MVIYSLNIIHIPKENLRFFVLKPENDLGFPKVQQPSCNDITTGLSVSYQKTRSQDECIKILSSVALHMSNKQLKDSFKRTDGNGQVKCCTDYGITRARLHSKSHGTAADRPKQ